MSRRIALIDDDGVFLAMLYDLLGEEGYEPHAFLDGIAADARIRACAPHARAIAFKFALAPQNSVLNRNDAAHPAEHLAIGPDEPATVILRATETQWINGFCRTNSSV